MKVFLDDFFLLLNYNVFFFCPHYLSDIKFTKLIEIYRERRGTCNKEEKNRSEQAKQNHNFFQFHFLHFFAQEFSYPFVNFASPI